jgi:uncharacterized protein (TIGR02145 family)
MIEVTIGKQIWMSENLNISIFRNGDLIFEAKNPEDWKMAAEKQIPAWTYYNNDPVNGEKFGKLYNWFAVNDLRGLAPEGWHIPTDEEWSVLSDFLGGNKNSANKLKQNEGWNLPGYKRGNGSNESGFGAKPGGYCYYFDSSPSTFEQIGAYGCWWSSTKKVKPLSAYTISMRNFTFWGWVDNSLIRSNHPLVNGYSVRCLKDY